MATIEDQREKSGFWFGEDQLPGLKTLLRLDNIYAQTESKFQKIEVIKTIFGRTLVTDGKTQSAELDESVYHETLVQPSMLLHSLLSKGDNGSDCAPKKVFIGGGGELATAREVLRNSSVEKCIMVDLDEEVINVSKKFLPTWGENSLQDERFELIIGDAYAYMNNTEEIFDIIIMDISDPIEAGPGIALYTQEFYKHAMTRLSPNGVFVTQSGCASFVQPGNDENLVDASGCFAPIMNTLQTVFDCAVPYYTFIPSFCGEWGFVMAFNVPDGENPQAVVKKLQELPGDVVEETIEKFITGGNKSLKHYDGAAHRAMFALKKVLKNTLAADKRIMTMENPLFMY